MTKQIHKIKFWEGEEDTLERYSELLSDVYNRQISSEYLKWKHLSNPIGKSIIAYAENEQGEMVAARAFWRMYCHNYPLYQPCDTVTHPNSQGQGLFKRLTLACLEVVDEDAVMINFPNNNSFPAYLKLGWQVLSDNRRLFTFRLIQSGKRIDSLVADLGESLPEEYVTYLDWRFGKHSFTDYNIWKHKNHLVIENATQVGVLALQNDLDETIAKGGLSQGYVLDNNKHVRVGFDGFSVALKGNSRTTYFTKSGSKISTSSIDTLKTTQINLLMDTF